MDKKQKQKIVKSLEIEHLTPSQQDKIISMVSENVSAKIDMIIWNKFIQEEKQELYKISRKGDNKKILKYLTRKIGNFSQLVEDITRETIEDFKSKRNQISNILI